MGISNSTLCFKPLHLGAGFLWLSASRPGDGRQSFQTPSPRGGIPLRSDDHGYQQFSTVFHAPPPRGGIPLAFRLTAGRRKTIVSNPFPSGRDSSVFGLVECPTNTHLFQTPSPRGGIPL